MIIDLVSAESRFTKFNEAIKAAGLTERFSSANNFTVFAPTNDAFGKLPQDKLAALTTGTPPGWLRSPPRPSG
jgi:uncharacterized surface protein with fasciclin (FAS1) repeats